jgi:hypothetical protein
LTNAINLSKIFFDNLTSGLIFKKLWSEKIALVVVLKNQRRKCAIYFKYFEDIALIYAKAIGMGEIVH